MIPRISQFCRRFALGGLVPCLLLAMSLGAAESGSKTFDLPPDTAEASLKRFAAQAGVEVLFTTETVAGVRTAEVKGAMNPADALQRLLAGTALTARLDEATGLYRVRRTDPAELPKAVAAPRVEPSLARLPAAVPSSQASDSAVQLSPFSVTADKDVGYLAGNSLAGSRLNTALKDTAASISVMTEEFLKDINATTLTEAVSYGNNVQLDLIDTTSFGGSPNDNNTFFSFDNFRVRGIPATVTRNYFSWRISTDNYNIGRIEESRGPNSILFGIGQPGGVINSSTKEPLTGRSFRRATAQFSSYEGRRGTFDVNQTSLDGKLGVRVNAVHTQGEGYRQWVRNEARRIDVAAKYDLDRQTSVRVEYETGDFDSVIARSTAVFDGFLNWRAAGSPTFATAIASNANIGITNFGTTTRVTYIGNDGRLLNMANTLRTTSTTNVIQDRSIVDYSVNNGGPGQQRNGYFHAFSAFLTRQLGAATFVELAYNHQDDHSVGYMADLASSGGNAIFADPNQRLPDGTANSYLKGLFMDGTWDKIVYDPRSDNTRLSVASEFDAGRWGKYRGGLMGEYESRVSRNSYYREVWEGAPFNSQPENAVNRVFRRNYATPGDWSSYYYNGPASSGLIKGLRDPVTGRTLSSTWVPDGAVLNDDPATQKTLIGSLQARYFKERLVLGLGLRKDWLNFSDRANLRDANSRLFAIDYANKTDYAYQAETRTFGGVAHLTKNISLTYNASNNFALPNAGVRILPEGLVTPAPESTGRDVGLGFTLLGGALYSRVTYYEVDLKRGGNNSFGGTTSAPYSITNLILDAEVAAGKITSAQAASHRIPVQNGATYNQHVEGYEANVTGNLTKAWRVQLNYSYTDGYNADVAPEVKAWMATAIPYFKSLDQSISTGTSGTVAQVLQAFDDYYRGQVDIEGVALPGNRKHKISVFTRYTLQSTPLKGLFIGGGYRHQSKNIIGRVAGNLVYGNSYWLSDAVAGYRFRNVPFLKTLELQLNVNNVFDRRAPLITRRRDTAAGEIQRWTPLEPRAWRLSASVEF